MGGSGRAAPRRRDTARLLSAANAPRRRPGIVPSRPGGLAHFLFLPPSLPPYPSLPPSLPSPPPLSVSLSLSHSLSLTHSLTLYLSIYLSTCISISLSRYLSLGVCTVGLLWPAVEQDRAEERTSGGADALQAPRGASGPPFRVGGARDGGLTGSGPIVTSVTGAGAAGAAATRTVAASVCTLAAGRRRLDRPARRIRRRLETDRRAETDNRGTAATARQSRSSPRPCPEASRAGSRPQWPIRVCVYPDSSSGGAARCAPPTRAQGVGTPPRPHLQNDCGRWEECIPSTVIDSEG